MNEPNTGILLRLQFVAVCATATLLALAPCVVLGTDTDALPPPPPWCRSIGAHAMFNETIDKCVLGMYARCKESYPDAPSPFAVQCGSGFGGVCPKGYCECSPETYAHFLEPVPVSYSFHSRYNKDYTCEPRRNIGEFCQDNDQNCAGSLWCLSDDNDNDSDPEARVCKCVGDWNETEQICYNDVHCFQFGYNMLYDDTVKQCKCKLGEECSDHDLCPGNSTLHADGRRDGPACLCNEGFLEVLRGRRCVKANGLGEHCELRASGSDFSQSDCTKGTGYIDGLCQCPPDDGLRWDTKLEHCVAKVGEGCDLLQEGRNRLCTPNTVCHWRVRGKRNPNFDSFCECPDSNGLQATTDGQCVPMYGTHCSRNESLNCVQGQGQGMACLDERCVCKGADAVSQVSDDTKPTKHQCLTLINSPCDNSTMCVDSAICDPASGKCVCDTAAGFIPSQNKARCFKALSFRANCTANQCDPSKGLICGETWGKCVCLGYGVEYHEDENEGAGAGACLAPLGSRCGHLKIQGSCLPYVDEDRDSAQPPACEYRVIKCKPGAECVSDAHNLLAGGIGETYCQALSVRMPKAGNGDGDGIAPSESQTDNLRLCTRSVPVSARDFLCLFCMHP